MPSLPSSLHMGLIDTHAHVKDTAGIRDGLHKGLRISTATSHVEAGVKKKKKTLFLTISGNNYSWEKTYKTCIV